MNRVIYMIYKVTIFHDDTMWEEDIGYFGTYTHAHDYLESHLQKTYGDNWSLYGETDRPDKFHVTLNGGYQGDFEVEIKEVELKCRTTLTI